MFTRDLCHSSQLTTASKSTCTLAASNTYHLPVLDPVHDYKSNNTQILYFHSDQHIVCVCISDHSRIDQGPNPWIHTSSRSSFFQLAKIIIILQCHVCVHDIAWHRTISKQLFNVDRLDFSLPRSCLWNNSFSNRCPLKEISPKYISNFSHHVPQTSRFRMLSRALGPFRPAGVAVRVSLALFAVIFFVCFVTFNTISYHTKVDAVLV